MLRAAIAAAVLFGAMYFTGVAARNAASIVVPAPGQHAIGETTGTDYGPCGNASEAAAVESSRRAAGGVYAIEPVRIR